MYYALTVFNNNITGVHESTVPFTASTFENSPGYRDHQLQPLEDPKEYITGADIREYNDDGTFKPLVERIEAGCQELPPGHKIVDGVLVADNPDPSVPEEEVLLAGELLSILLGGEV